MTINVTVIEAVRSGAQRTVLERMAWPKKSLGRFGITAWVMEYVWSRIDEDVDNEMRAASGRERQYGSRSHESDWISIVDETLAR